MSISKTIFFISDGTGITAANVGHSLLTQFPDVQLIKQFRPFIDSLEKARAIVAEINSIYEKTGEKPVLFTTIVDDTLRNEIHQSQAVMLDFFHGFIEQLEHHWKIDSNTRIGGAHGLENNPAYNMRIDALNYTLSTDDGLGYQLYPEADVILVGVSRSGKTPTCLYLAMHFGIYAANYAYTDDDGQYFELPPVLKAQRHKLFGLIISPDHLHEIRSKRKPNTDYASLARCQHELKNMKDLLLREKIPFIDATVRSVEEISTTIVTQLGLTRRDV